MSQQPATYACDRCGKVSAEDVVRQSWIEVAYGHALASAQLSVDGGHICDDCLPAFADFFAKMPRANIGLFATHAAALEIFTEEHVPVGKIAHIKQRAQQPFSPSGLVILDNPADWIVHDVRIGLRSQFAQAGDVPGDLFAEGAAVGPITFETIQTAMDVGFVVTYRGKDPEGSRFRAKFVGREVGFAPTDPTKYRPSTPMVELSNPLSSTSSKCELVPTPPQTQRFIEKFGIGIKPESEVKP